MTTEIRKAKIKREPKSPQDDSNEIVKRWRQFRFVCNGTGRYRTVMTGNDTAEWDMWLLGCMQIIWVMSGIVTLFIAARIGLKMVAIDAGTPFGRFVIYLTDLFLRPFSGVPETLTTAHITVLELSALYAIIIYPFAAWCVVKLLQYLLAPSR